MRERLFKQRYFQLDFNDPKNDKEGS